MNILVTLPLSETQKKKLHTAAPEHKISFYPREELTESILRDADIILGNPKSPAQLSCCSHLKWLQLSNAGTDGYCVPGVLPQGIPLTNVTGVFGVPIAEHMIGCLFELRKKLQRYYSNQLHHLWKPEGFIDLVEGSAVLVIGFGNIGSTFGRKMKALGCRITGIRRRPNHIPDWIDGLYSPDHIDELLPLADVVALCMPATSDTVHVLDRKRIGLLKKSAIVLNVGRGSAVDTEALTEALYSGAIGGAALDVTDPEPLPAAHPLWAAPNAIITPHISGNTLQPETLNMVVDLFAENLQRYFSGEPLKNLIDLETGYCATV